MEARPMFSCPRGRFNSRSSPLSFSQNCVGYFLWTVFIASLSRYVNAFQVIGGNKTVAQGETVILPCKLLETTESLTQISWQRKTREKTQNDNFFTILPDKTKYLNGQDNRFKFMGNFNERNGSLQLSDTKLLDEGSYTCIFTLFPSGNHKTVIPLNILVAPVSSVRDNLPVLGDEEVLLATCMAASSRPPAEVKWLLDALADKVRATTNSTAHANGTTTTISWLFGIPTKEMNHRVVQCVVTSPALSEPKVIPFTIQVYFSPSVVKISLTSEGTFLCVTEANPKATFNWTRSDQSGSQSSVGDSATLKFQSMSSEVNGLYQCEASNLYGRNHGFLYVDVTPGSCHVCWTLFGLLVVAVLAASAFCLYKSGKWPRKEERPQSRANEETEPL